MSPEKETRIVGRCTECNQPILEVADVRFDSSGGGIRVETEVVRRCGCGDFVPREPED